MEIQTSSTAFSPMPLPLNAGTTALEVNAICVMSLLAACLQLCVVRARSVSLSDVGRYRR